MRPGTLSSSACYPHTKVRFHPPQAVRSSFQVQQQVPFRISVRAALRDRFRKSVKAVLRGRFRISVKAVLPVLPYFPAAREASQMNCRCLPA